MREETHAETKERLTRTALNKPAELPAIVQQRMKDSAQMEPDGVLQMIETRWTGLDDNEVTENRRIYGDNVVIQGRRATLAERLMAAFINPFTLILIALALISVLTDITFAPPEERSYVTVTIISAMVVMSGVLRFIQETRSGNAAEKLTSMIVNTTAIVREETGEQERVMEEVVVGDIIRLAAGDMIPADMRILAAKDLFLSESTLTGESAHVEKFASPSDLDSGNVLDYDNLAFMGTNVISGSGTAVVLATGQDTIFGQIAKTLKEKPTPTSFERGVNHVSSVLIRFMLVMVPIVFLISDFHDEDYLRQMAIAARRHDLVAIRLFDPRERELPAAGLVELIDAEDGSHMLVDTSSPDYRAALQNVLAYRRDSQRQEMTRRSVDVIDVPTDGNAIDPLVRFFELRRRRLR